VKFAVHVTVTPRLFRSFVVVYNGCKLRTESEVCYFRLLLFFFVVSWALPLGRRFLKVRGPGASNPRTHCSSISAAYTSTKILIHIACVCWAKWPNMRANVGRQVLRKDRRNNLKMFSVVLFRSFLATYRTTKHVGELSRTNSQARCSTNDSTASC